MSTVPEGYVSATPLAGGGLLLVRADGARVVVSRDAHGALYVDVRRDGHATTRAIVEADRAVGARSQTRAGEDGRVCSPTSGVLRSVVVSPGDTVTEGAVLGHVEAMKMHIELRAAVAGVVASLDAAAGDAVERGALVLRITPMA